LDAEKPAADESIVDAASEQRQENSEIPTQLQRRQIRAGPIDGRWVTIRIGK